MEEKVRPKGKAKEKAKEKKAAHGIKDNGIRIQAHGIKENGNRVRDARCVGRLDTPQQIVGTIKDKMPEVRQCKLTNFRTGQ